tara:strand:- start:551 stop:769 length:219 start_codon:yes stop_codon:yes gene_type:complete
MKSKIKRRKSEKKELPFPKLMESNQNEGFVVLFTSQNVGVAVTQGFHVIGHTSNSWDMFAFGDYDGKVILKN